MGELVEVDVGLVFAARVLAASRSGCTATRVFSCSSHPPKNRKGRSRRPDVAGTAPFLPRGKASRNDCQLTKLWGESVQNDTEKALQKGLEGPFCQGNVRLMSGSKHLQERRLGNPCQSRPASCQGVAQAWAVEIQHRNIDDRICWYCGLLLVVLGTRLWIASVTLTMRFLILQHGL